jgi:hypothetical protein
MSRGRYHDPDRSYVLPDHWPAVDELDSSLLDACLDRALAAVGGAGRSAQPAERSLRAYFNPDGEYAGALFNTIPDDDGYDLDDRVVAADLLAVTTLSMKLSARLVRQLLEDREKQHRVRSQLRQIPRNRPIAELGSGDDEAAPASVRILAAMDDLQSELRRTPSPSSNKWVFASKLAARKRPELFPVRDNVVCRYLAGSRTLRRGHIGSFRTDLQVFAFLMSCRDLRTSLASHRDMLVHHYGSRIDAVPDLRLLDCALWMTGVAAGYDS